MGSVLHHRVETPDAANRLADFRLADWTVEPSLDRISRGAEIHKLEPRTMRLLVCLSASAGAVVSIDRLLTEVWSGVIVGPASVYQSVSQLRKMLGDTDPNPTYIATVPRKGYRLVAPVAPFAPASEVSVPAIGTDSRHAGEPIAPPLVKPLAASPATPHESARWGRIALLAAATAAVLAMAGAVISWSWRKSPPASPSAAVARPAPSIVVLPFVDLTEDKQGQFFCDGLTEELSNWLAQIPTLKVVARTSAFAFRGQQQDARKIGQALATDHLLEGSLRRSGDHMRVTVQLIDARNGYHLWSASYDRPLTDTIKMQEDISRSVAQTLEIRLSVDAADRLASRGSGSPAAYQSYLLGRHHQQERTVAANAQAVRLYRQAITQDPQFALAYVALAYALLNDNWLNDRPIADIAREADPLLRTALSIDPRLADAFAVRGALRGEQMRTEDALKDLERAVALNPNDAMAHAEIGRLYLGTGRPRDAVSSYTRATELDPLNAQPQAQRCLALQDLGRYDEAGGACARARSLQPDGYWPLAVTSSLASAQGRLDEALEWNQSALRLAPDVFDLYRERAESLLVLGQGPPARTTLALAAEHTPEVLAVDEFMADVDYFERGAKGLADHLNAGRLEASTQANTLFAAAYDRLLLGDARRAQADVDSALRAPDFLPADLDNAWYAARWGSSARLIIALAAAARGDAVSVSDQLGRLTALLDRLDAAGEVRFGVDELRAAVLAMQGDPKGAMQNLSRAAAKGWRASWWAARRPEYASLRKRQDFRLLLADIDRSNHETSRKLHR